MTGSPEDKSYAAETPELARYVAQTFDPEDDLLREIRQRAAAAGLPPIHVSPFDGRHLEVLALAAGARRIVEIGTLAGLSGVCLARALPADGVLHTFEFESRHAEVAAESFRRAGLSEKVRLHVGSALDRLPDIEPEGPFDLIFVDADKINYPKYLAWAAEHLRVGGVVLCDNAFGWGLVIKEEGELPGLNESDRTSRAALLATNSTLADPTGRFRATMLPTGEGLAMGVKVR